MLTRNYSRRVLHSVICVAALSGLLGLMAPGDISAAITFTALLLVVTLAGWERTLADDVADGLFALATLVGAVLLNWRLGALLIVAATLLVSSTQYHWHTRPWALARRLAAAALAFGLIVVIRTLLPAQVAPPTATALVSVSAALGMLAVYGATLMVGVRRAGNNTAAGRTPAEQFGLSGGFAVLAVLCIAAWQVAPILAPATAIPFALIARLIDDAAGGTRQRVDRQTGLPNAAAFTAHLAGELARGLRFGRPAGLILVELSLAGGRVDTTDLRRVADLLRNRSREYDLVGYLGRSRFAVLLPETSEDDTYACADRLYAGINELRAASAASALPLSATATVGIALHPRHGDSARALLTAAEAALQATKEARQQRASTPASVPAAPAAQVTADPNTPAPGSLPEPAVPATARRWTARDLFAPTWTVPAYIAGLWLTALALFVVTFQPIPRTHWPLVLTLAVLGIAARHLRVELYGRGSISTIFVVLIAGGILVGPTAIMPIGVIVGFIVWPRTAKLRTFVFDAAMNAVASGLLALAAQHLATVLPDTAYFHTLLVVRGLALGVLAYILNAAPLVGVMALSERSNPVQLWRERFDWLLPYYPVLGLFAAFAAWAGHVLGPTGLILFALPAFMLQLAKKQYVDRTKEHVTALREAHATVSATNKQLATSLTALEESYTATLNAFSGMLEARDHETEGHCERVVTYATTIGQALGLSESDLAALGIGALLHDIGKVGVSDAILRKPSALTPEEWAEMRQHPEIGHRLTNAVPFLQSASPVVRHHHERWDGAGYPDGLRGEDIPLMARIFAVADAYDAMLSDRPYRRGLAPEEALRRLQQDAGTQFDPLVVDAMVMLAQRENWRHQTAGAAAFRWPPAAFLTLFA
ncbi:MAG: diguanylate cyclase [Thermomicrobiales bacterium]